MAGKNGDGEVRPLKLDTATDSVNIVDYEHHEIHSGSHYFVQGFLEIPGIDDVLDFTFQMPNTTKWIHWTWEIETEKEMGWYIYENVVATNALDNAITPYNSNRNSTNTSGATMKYEIQADLAAADADTDVSGGTLIASGISGVMRTAGAAKRDNELVLKQNTLYCLRATATAAGYITFKMEWYEHQAVS